MSRRWMPSQEGNGGAVGTPRGEGQAGPDWGPHVQQHDVNWMHKVPHLAIPPITSADPPGHGFRIARLSPHQRSVPSDPHSFWWLGWLGTSAFPGVLTCVKPLVGRRAAWAQHAALLGGAAPAEPDSTVKAVHRILLRPKARWAMGAVARFRRAMGMRRAV